MKRGWHQQFKRAPKEARTSPDGITHASVSEAHRWARLQMDESLGLIRNLQRQIRYPLTHASGISILTPTKRVMVYTPDFQYEKRQPDGSWVEVIEDHKGFMDKTAELRIAVFEALYGKTVYIHKR